MTRAKGTTLLALLLISAIWAWIVPQMHIEMSIARFVPVGEERRAAELVRAVAASDLSGTIVLDISGSDEETLVKSAALLRETLAKSPFTRDVRSGFDEQAQRATYTFIEQYPAPIFLPASSFRPEQMDARIKAMQQELRGPFSPLVARLMPRDPLGAVFGLLRSSEAIDGRHLTSKDGILISEAGDHAFLFYSSKGNAFDAGYQRQCLAAIHAAFEHARNVAKTPNALTLEMSGAAPYTVDSEAQIRGDIQRISTISTIGILVLFALFFRSIRMLILGLVPLAVGIMVATVGTHLAFGEVHGLTLAFGTSLLGVGIDYAEHYFAHFAMEPEAGAVKIMKTVWPGLWMGALTTVVGLAGIAWADFPCADQMALFSCLAIVGALFATRFLLPPWMPVKYTRPPLPHALEMAADSMLRRGAKWIRSGLIPKLALAAFAALTIIGLVRVHFIDDVSALLATDPKIVREDENVRNRMTTADPGRFAIVAGRDEQSALEALAAATRELEKAQEMGAITHFVSLGGFIQSKAAQEQSLDAARTSLPALKASLSANGFRAEAFGAYEQALMAGRTMSLDQFFASPIGAQMRPLAPKIGTEQAFVLPLSGVRSLSELRKLVPDAVVVDERALLQDTYAHVRKRVLQLVAVGLVFVLGILFLRYRALPLVGVAFLPGALASLITLALFGWMHIPLNILHVIGFVLVLSMGVDFGIFVVEGRASPEQAARSLVSVLTASLTTILSFGLLALSQNPALRALGLTAALGVLTSCILCPIAVLLGTASHAKKEE